MFGACANALVWALAALVILRYVLGIHGARDIVLPLIAAALGAASGWRQTR